MGYVRLLRRYLSIKYQTNQLAEESFHQLLANIEEIRTLSVDVINFFANYRSIPRSASQNGENIHHCQEANDQNHQEEYSDLALVTRQ